MVPWLTIFGGFGLSEIIKDSTQYSFLDSITIAGLLAVILLFIDACIADRKFYTLSKDPYQFLRKAWGEEAVYKYKDQIQIGKYINQTTTQKDKILLCGWAPHILLYADRPHFTNELCLYTEDYLEMYNQDNPSYYRFLENFIKSKYFKIKRHKNNVFYDGYPDVIVFGESNISIEGFEQLCGIKYSLDENAGGFPVFRADIELTELMDFFEIKFNFPQQKSKNQNLKRHKISIKSDSSDLNDSFSILKDIMKKEPSNETCLLQLSDRLINMRNYRLLFNFSRRLIEKDLVSDNMKLQLLNKITESLFHQNKLADAEASIQNVLRIDPNNTTALNNLGVLRFNQNNLNEAAEYFKKSLMIDPNNQDAIANMKALS